MDHAVNTAIQGGTTIAEFSSLEQAAAGFPVVFCDVWGVVHDGVRPFLAATNALAKARASGAVVVLITNSPRPCAGVIAQLQAIGVADAAWDRVVTSGDVTRDLIANGPRRLLHIGPERDLPLFDGLDVEFVEEFEADTVVCTGLFDDATETPEDYADMLKRLRSRNLPFVCANPDIIVDRGDQQIWCAGALARDYGLLGGRTLVAGKPFRPIYDLAMAQAGEVLGRAVAVDDVLAIGDGMLTDVKGAADYGCAVLYISGGIHAREYGTVEGADPHQLAGFLRQHGRQPLGVMHRLK